MRSSAGSPTCQSPVPADSTTNRSDMPASAASWANTMPAMGERQMLPLQTNETRNGAPGPVTRAGG